MTDDVKEQDVQETPAAEAAAVAPADAEAEFDLADYLRQYQDLEAQLKQAKEDMAEAEARHLRLQADFDNYRRRQREEAARTADQASAKLAESLLPVVDNFERAVNSLADETPEKNGVVMIAKQLLAVLENAGLTEIAALGEEFDPNLHHAVAQAEAGEENRNKITLVLQKGYNFKGKLLRAPMVQVGK